jgi:NADH-quinone oxidoreductase subunit H
MNFLVLPLAFVTYFIAGLAETNRAPFDLPEAESELVAGFLTEYSGMRWAIFFLAEYGEVTVVSSIVATLWFGAWHGPFVEVFPLLGVLWFTLKTYFFVLVFMWIRATLPRLRIDQLMSLCWKVLIPLTLANLMITSVLLLAFPTTLVPVAIANWILLGVFVLVLPYIQRRRLVALRARLRTAAA